MATVHKIDFSKPRDGEDGVCLHCGRDNAGYEDQICSDDCEYEIQVAA